MQFKETFQNRFKENILYILPLIKINVTLNDHKLAKMGIVNKRIYKSKSQIVAELLAFILKHCSTQGTF